MDLDDCSVNYLHLLLLNNKSVRKYSSSGWYLIWFVATTFNAFKGDFVCDDVCFSAV